LCAATDVRVLLEREEAKGRAMPRQPRDIAAHAPYHILNRSNGRFTMFESDASFDRFCRLLGLASEKHRMPIIAFCIMPNHWHIIVRPNDASHLARFVAWLSNTHTRRYHIFHNTVGQGPLYQGRYKAILLKDDDQLWAAARYVERNPVTASFVASCKEWPWSSVSRFGKSLVPLSQTSFQLTSSWTQQVDEVMTNIELENSMTWLE
jgi:putative transposase